MRTPFDLLYLLCAALLIGLSAAGIPPVVRAAPLVQRWMMRGIRPWACDLCMSVWSTVLAALGWFFVAYAVDDVWHVALLLAGVPAFVVTFAVVRHNGEPLGPPPSFADLEDSGVGLFKGTIEQIEVAAEAPAPTPGAAMIQDAFDRARSGEAQR